MRKGLVWGGKFIVAIAAAWALAASLYIFFSPVSIHGVTGVMLRDSTTVVEAFTRNQSWYEAQGLWGVLWLILFSGLYILAVWVACRGNIKALAGLSATVVVLSIVTGFSIGAAYMPAAIGLIIGTFVLLLSRPRRAQ